MTINHRNMASDLTHKTISSFMRVKKDDFKKVDPEEKAKLKAQVLENNND